MERRETETEREREKERQRERESEREREREREREPERVEGVCDPSKINKQTTKYEYMYAYTYMYAHILCTKMLNRHVPTKRETEREREL